MGIMVLHDGKNKGTMISNVLDNYMRHFCCMNYYEWQFFFFYFFSVQMHWNMNFFPFSAMKYRSISVIYNWTSPFRYKDYKLYIELVEKLICT